LIWVLRVRLWRIKFNIVELVFTSCSCVDGPFPRGRSKNRSRMMAAADTEAS